MSTKHHNWKLLRSSTVFNSKYLAVRHDVFRRPDGRTHNHTVVVSGQVVAVLALTGNQEVVLVKQFRPAVRKYTLDLPGGGVDRKETPATAARRELREETGYRAGQMTLLAKYYSDSGRSDQVRFVYLARHLVPGQAAKNAHEMVRIKRIPLNKLIHHNNISENTLLTTLLLYQNKYGRHSSPRAQGS